ncbi:unnamed protein product [Clavelina lepadiformis]|uniref:DNA-directed RNA polymerase subunit n=1 Tax=Clavelina lepadiformis TaxID=159417 RepID=A0ABP0H3W4_CLALP
MLRHLGTPRKSISTIKFTCFNGDEIRKLSVKKVTNPHSLDALLNPTEGGLYDAAYGASSRDEACSTCDQGSVQCPGHMGHIELPLPIYHPLFFKTLFYLLRGSCLKCQKLLIPRQKLLLFAVQLEALENGLVQTVYALKEAENEVKGVSVYDKQEETVTLQEVQDHLQEVLTKHYSKMKSNRSSFIEKEEENKDNNGWSRNASELHLQLVCEFVHLLAKNVSRCPHCGGSVVNVRTEHNSKIYVMDVQDKKDKVQEATQSYMTPSSVRDHIAALWENEKEVLSRIFVAMADAAGKHDEFDTDVPEPSGFTNAVDVFFLRVLPVPPSRFRPIGCVNDRHFESPQTTSYSKVMMDCVILRALMKKLNRKEVSNEVEEAFPATEKVKMANKNMDLLSSLPGKTLMEKLENAWHRLQQHVNSLFDSDLDRLTVAGADKTPGIKQLLEKKDGLFRKHMMGKRVNYAARSVISPDPYIATNEIGIPLVFASKLTYPTPVTSWNVKELRKAVINGPKVHPGATHVVSEGRTTLLSATDQSQREAVAKQLIASDDKKRHGLTEPKIVMRHIQSGDIMLLNRQPTLHKGSIMAHKVRVLPGEKTLRLHYANCKSYNADFDGDEMNAHFPQTELCKSEAFQLMLTDKQYLSGKDGKPLSCLIQDHMVAGVNICMRGRFFNQEEYQLLLYNALMHLPFKIKLMKPTLLKPQMLWSGKQVISTLLINIIPHGMQRINLTGKAKIGAKNWQKFPSKMPVISYIEPGDMCESQVIIRGAELLCGILDKGHYGATEFGLVHAMYELYGGEISGQLLTCLARLFTAYLQYYKGFTLGVKDILVTPTADEGRFVVIDQTKNDGVATVAKTLNVKQKHNHEVVMDALWDAHVATTIATKQGEDRMAAVDHAMKKVSNSVNDQIAKQCTGNGLLMTFPNNNLQLMVISGAKGGAVNCMQISCLLGQIELEGRRPPLMPSGRSAPSFMPYDTTLRAGGFISQRFLTGIRPQEYFYHCMAGREGLVDTAVKTSRSGYLQRCLIKHLEGLMLAYDMTVRDSDGGVVQFLYGEDGIDISKTAYLQQKQCNFVVNNHKAIENKLPPMQQVEKIFDVMSADRKWKKYDKIKKKRDRKLRKAKLPSIARTSGFLEYGKTLSCGNIAQVTRQWNELGQEQKRKFLSNAKKHRLPDPVISIYRPDLYYGSMSDRFHHELRQYLKENPDGLPQIEEKSNHNSALTLTRLESLQKLRYQRSLCQPGESVGLLAAQSIGEPSTQMTLNTFHFAGRGEMNVTLGIPRLREILMVATKQIKTPQVTVPVKDGMNKRAKRLCKELTKTLLSQVLQKFTVEERLVVGKGEPGDRYRRCIINMHILPEQQFRKDLALSRENVLHHVEKHFLRRFLFALAKQMKKRATESLVVEQRVARETARRVTSDGESQEQEIYVEPPPEPEDNLKNPEDPRAGDDPDEEVEFDDGDETMAAQKRKKREDVDYEEQDTVMSDDDNQDGDMDMSGLPEAIAIDETSRQSFENGQDGDVYKEAGEKLSNTNSASVELRVQAVKNLGHGDISVEDYKFDVASNGWCQITLLMPLTSVNVDLVSLVRDQASASAVRQVPGLTRCILIPTQGQSTVDEMAVNFVSEGINFHKIFENEDCLNVNSLYCNCVHSVANVYGIEAARCVVVKEIANVFAVYGIEVDPRHLSLVGDYMCYEGEYKPFNRVAIESCISPLQQMSFETTMKFLNNAALYGLSDRLQSPSARIVAGQIVRGGTGSFSLVYPVAKYA